MFWSCNLSLCREIYLLDDKMNELKFTKMHGAGNDYIYINAMDSCPAELEKLAIRLSDRHKGIGSDGLVAIMPSEIADFRMRMFNADGSEGKMCGNAARCIGKYVFEKGLTRKTSVLLETLSGIKTLELHTDKMRSRVLSVTVDMGEPILEPRTIPVSDSIKSIKNISLKVSTEEYKVTAVSMGNPHGVIFCKAPEKMDIETPGKELEVHPVFPERANIEFVEVVSPAELKMRVWERGSGETLACGTGACAALVASVLNGKSERRAIVHLKGGDLEVEWDASSNHVFLTGPAEISFEGTVMV